MAASWGVLAGRSEARGVRAGRVQAVLASKSSWITGFIVHHASSQSLRRRDDASHGDVRL
jgi:hypothetical protein